MVSFELNESYALQRAFVTPEELAKRRNVTDIDLYDFELYANDTVEIKRRVAEEEDEVYEILGQKGTDHFNPTNCADRANPTDPTDHAGDPNCLEPISPSGPFHPAVVRMHGRRLTLKSSFAASPGARFITTSFLGLMMDICIMQPGRVFVVAIIMVVILA